MKGQARGSIAAHSDRQPGYLLQGLCIKAPSLLCAGCTVRRRSAEADTPAGLLSQDPSTSSAAVEIGAAEAGQPGGEAPASQDPAASFSAHC